MGIHAFCIHAHFYQPPREDPLTGSIPVEPSASPYPNWNERIHAECYRPNADLHNFERISFNIGPTLHNWIASHDPTTNQKIVEQDQANLRRYKVGNAIAQAYNHTILPLGAVQDKITQVYWGIADFKRRFKRASQGMWLPETAVDYETLDILARQGIQFTILAPWQAQTPDIDTTHPYKVRLSGKRSITVFFYQSELSAQISFNPQATINADHFSSRQLEPAFHLNPVQDDEPQLLLFASDGELYGHHQPLRDRFLAHLVNGATASLGIKATFPALWLREHPAQEYIEIREQTSWSCHHGISRWKELCPCTPGNGQWKIQLRTAFEQLADELDRLYLENCIPFTKDPWGLRNRYIHVVLEQMSFQDLLTEFSISAIRTDQIRRIRFLLEMQRERQRMFTSCGWFFDDFDRIEPRNNVAYAAQAVWLARLATGIDLEPQTSYNLEKVVSQYTNLRADVIFQGHLHRAEGIMNVRIGFGA